jgi:hypothetical protein
VRHFNKILYIGAGAFALSVSPISPLDVVAPVESASAHAVTVISGQCTSQTSATFDFSAIYMGDGARDIVVNGPNGTSGKVTTNVDGTHTVTVSGFQPQTGVVNFTWTSTAVTPNGTPPIAVDFNKCTPVEVYEPSIVAYSQCVNDHAATINGTIAGFPKGPVTVSADRGDISFGWGEFENGEFSFDIDVFNELGPQDGPLTFSIVAAAGSYSVSTLVEVQFQKCVEVTTTTAATTTTTAATTTTTQATTTTTAATTTTTQATTTTTAATTTTVPPSTGPTTTKPTTSSTLPATGSNPYTDDAARYALVLLVLGIFAVIVSVRRKPTMS